MNRVGGSRQQSLNQDSKKSDFSPNSFCLRRITKLCFDLIIVAAFASLCSQTWHSLCWFPACCCQACFYSFHWVLAHWKLSWQWPKRIHSCATLVPSSLLNAHPCMFLPCYSGSFKVQFQNKSQFQFRADSFNWMMSVLSLTFWF